MNSTGETPDADGYGVDSGSSSNDDEFAPPRVRRSTYTPPPQYRDSVAAPVAAPEAVAAPVAARAAQPEPAAQQEPSVAAPVPAPTPTAPPVRAPASATEQQQPPVWAPPARETPVWSAPASTAPASTAAPTAAPTENLWTAPPVEPAPGIPDWSAQQRTTTPPAAEPLASTPVWTPARDVPVAPPVAPPVEPTSPYRPWTPDSHVDADAYWNTTRPASHRAPEPVVAQPIELIPAPAEPTPVRPTPADVTPAEVAAAPVWSDPVQSAPVWSLDADGSADPYRAWTPDQTPTVDAGSAARTDFARPDIATPDIAMPDGAASAYMTPDDEASTLAAHAPPVGQPWIPQRRSLPDDELLSVLEAADSEPGGTLQAMDALENEMRLREEEVQEYREWEDSMLAVGTPEALAVVAQVRPEFTAIVIPPELEPTQAIPIQYPAGDGGEAPWPLVKPVESAEPTPAPTAETEHAPDETGVSHDMPQSWFDALVAPTEAPAQPVAPEPVAPDPVAQPASTAVAVHTGYPVPNFDQLLAEEPTAEPADVVPEKRRKLPFGVAVADGQPQHPSAEVAAPSRAPIFLLEQSGQQPTPRELRTGRASRMFWLWFAANSSVVSIGLGAVIFSLGMSLRQSVVATLAGVALSFLPLGLGTLAGKRSGQPTVVVSRAAFGVVGNVVPAALAVVSRVFWGAVLLWLFAASVSTFLGGDGPTAGLVVVFIVVGVMLAVVVAFLGYWLLARVQLVVSVVSAVLIAGFVALTWQRVDLRVALSVDDGPWVLVITGAVAVFSFLGLVWANSAADLARYQRPGGSGGSNMLWANFGTTLPSFVLIAYGALLAASDTALGTALVADPVDALTAMLPGWYAAPLIIATGLSLLSGVVLATYSGAFALQAVGVRAERQWATLLVGGLVAVLAVGFSLLDVSLVAVFRDLATTIAVPVAAWAGIFAADIMIRNRALHAASLMRVGGVYPRVNWINLPALLVITAVGWAFTTATVAGLGWQGYGFSLAGVDLSGDLATSDLGVLVALVLALLTPIATGIPAIRRQEAAARQFDRATPK